MHMGAALDGSDCWHAYIGYIFEDLNPLIVDLAPDTAISNVAER
jgi:hypothetical protein